MSAAALSTVELIRSQVRSALPRLDLPLTLVPRPEPGRLPTGIAPLDRIANGGLPRGAMSEIIGPASSGRTTVFHSLLARSIDQGEFCALIDAHDSFDPRGAAEMGADLSRLLWIRCSGSLENALKATDRITQAGGFGLVVFDLADADPLAARRISLASWFRLRHAVAPTESVLLVLGRQFHARSCSAMQIEMRRCGALWSPHLFRGVRLECESVRRQIAKCARFTTEQFPSLA